MCARTRSGGWGSGSRPLGGQLTAGEAEQLLKALLRWKPHLGTQELSDLAVVFAQKLELLIGRVEFLQRAAAAQIADQSIDQLIVALHGDRRPAHRLALSAILRVASTPVGEQERGAHAV